LVVVEVEGTAVEIFGTGTATPVIATGNVTATSEMCVMARRPFAVISTGTGGAAIMIST
jgi:hypothetical protein